MKEEVSVSYFIQASKEWETIQCIKSFDLYLNIFSASLSKYNTLTSTSQKCQYSRIAEADTRGNGQQGRRRGIWRVIWRIRRGRGVHGRGRSRYQYKPYSLARKYGSLVTEARVCPKEQWVVFSHDKRESVTRKKTVAGCLDGGTP